MLFGELVRDADLGIQVVVAAEHASDRVVRSGVITDLSNPKRFLAPDTVVLTHALWSSREGGARAFVAAVAEAGATALVVGLAEVGQVPGDVVELCRTAGLTLATAGPEVDFSRVVASIAAAQPDSDAVLARRGAELRARLARATGIDGVLAVFTAEAGCDCWLMTSSGALLGTSGDLPSVELRGAIWNELLARDRSAGDERASQIGGSLVDTVTDPDGAVLAYLITTFDSVRTALPSLLDHLQTRLAATAAVQRAEAQAATELVLAVRSASGSDGELSARLRLLGIDPTGPLVVVSGIVDDAGFPPEATLGVLLQAVAASGAEASGATVDGCAVVIATAFEAAFAALEGALPLLAERTIRVGVSDPVDAVRDLGNAVGSSLVRMRAAKGMGPVVIADRSTALTHRELLAQFAAPVRDRYARDVLDPLVEYDSKNGGDLLATLRLFLDNNGAWVETARMLDLHPNTMRYRMSRVEDLTHRDLTRMADRVDLFLALACRDL